LIKLFVLTVRVIFQGYFNVYVCVSVCRILFICNGEGRHHVLSYLWISFTLLTHFLLTPQVWEILRDYRNLMQIQ